MNDVHSDSIGLSPEHAKQLRKKLKKVYKGVKELGVV